MASSLSIQAVSERTGLSPHVIRAWERRYGAIEPERSAGMHRHYSEAEVERLVLLQRAVDGGHSIGRIASLPDDELRAMVETRSSRLAPATSEDSAAPYRDEAMTAVVRYDLRLLEVALSRAVMALGYQGLLRLVIAPLAQDVGERWRSGEITVAHEHFFTAVVKVFLGDLTRRVATPLHAPRIVVCTPAGQLHELGAVIAATEASSLGWRSIYLGPNLPAHEIAGAAYKNEVSAVALSIVYPEDDPGLGEELTELARLVPDGTRILVGGRAAAGYLATITRIGAIYADGLASYSASLDEIRSLPRPAIRSIDEDPPTEA